MRHVLVYSRLLNRTAYVVQNSLPVGSDQYDDVAAMRELLGEMVAWLNREVAILQSEAPADKPQIGLMH